MNLILNLKVQISKLVTRMMIYPKTKIGARSSSIKELIVLGKETVLINFTFRELDSQSETTFWNRCTRI